MTNWEMAAECWIHVMSRRTGAQPIEWFGRVARHCVLALAGACGFSAHATAEAQDAAGAAPRHRATRHVAAPSLDDRVKALSKALDLDAKQQSELKTLLDDQREQVRRVWANAAVPVAYRIGETQAIDDKTAERIRALLNEEQKQKYNPPRQPQPAAQSVPNVEAWMNPAQSR